MATQAEHPVQTVHRAFGTTNGSSLGDKIKDTYSSFEDLAKAKLELNKARLEATKPLLVSGVFLTAVGNALLIALTVSLAIVLASVAEESWGFSARGAWGFTTVVLAIGLGIVWVFLQKVIGKGKTTWKPN